MFEGWEKKSKNSEKISKKEKLKVKVFICLSNFKRI